MICPRCDEGALVKIKFKHDGKVAFLCDFCEAFWFEDEHIKSSTGHVLESYGQGGEDFEYPIEELPEKDQDHQPARYVSYK